MNYQTLLPRYIFLPRYNLNDKKIMAFSDKLPPDVTEEVSSLVTEGHLIARTSLQAELMWHMPPQDQWPGHSNEGSLIASEVLFFMEVQSTVEDLSF